MPSRISFDVEIDHWIKGAARFDARWASKTDSGFSNAAKDTFDQTQRDVHVITGRLRDSGTLTVDREGGELVMTIRYAAPYAIYEYGRGGDHDFYTPAIVEHVGKFLAAMMNGVEREIDSWR